METFNGSKYVLNELKNQNPNVTDLRTLRLPAFIFSSHRNKALKLILFAHHTMWFSIEI